MFGSFFLCFLESSFNFPLNPFIYSFFQRNIPVSKVGYTDAVWFQAIRSWLPRYGQSASKVSERTGGKMTFGCTLQWKGCGQVVWLSLPTACVCGRVFVPLCQRFRNRWWEMLKLWSCRFALPSIKKINVYGNNNGRQENHFLDGGR